MPILKISKMLIEVVAEAINPYPVKAGLRCRRPPRCCCSQYTQFQIAAPNAAHRLSGPNLTNRDRRRVLRHPPAELFRTRLNHAHPTASIDGMSRGSWLTLQRTAGVYGPIQDHVILFRAMLLRP